MRYWQRVEERLSRTGIKSIVTKMTIEDKVGRTSDFYLKIGWWRGRPVWVDITRTRHARSDTAALDPVALEQLPSGERKIAIDLVQRLDDSTRGFIEVVCREASLLLASRRCTLKALADMWRATKTDPKGTCAQAQDALGDTVNGPLDAAAKIMHIKGPGWENEMAHTYTESEIEEMIENCQGAVDDREEDFTPWEVAFIKDVAMVNETAHLTDDQVDKLEQIWEERDCG